MKVDLRKRWHAEKKKWDTEGRERGMDRIGLKLCGSDRRKYLFLLYLLWLFTAGLSPFLPPSHSICQTDSCWPTPSVVVHFPSRVSLIQPEPSVPLSPSKYAFISHVSPLPPDPRHQSGRTRSSLQFTDGRLKMGYMRTSVTSAFSQSLFGLLNLLLVMCLTWHRSELYDTWEEPEWFKAVHSNCGDDWFELGITTYITNLLLLLLLIILHLLLLNSAWLHKISL